MGTDLLLQAAFALVTALLYAWIARLVQHRSLSAEARAANAMFATWWGSLGILYGLAALYNAAAALDLVTLPIAIAYIDILLVLVCVALFGLLGYLLYLYTGSRKGFFPLGIAYAALAIGLFYLIAWMQPTGFKTGGIGLQLDYARQPPDIVSLAVGFLISIPILGAALLYGSLYFRVKTPEPRYRIALVASAFLFWFGWSAISTALALPRRFPDSVALYVWNSAIAILVPLVIVMAFRPPKWVRARLAAAAGDA